MPVTLNATAVPLPPLPTTVVYAKTSRSVTGTPPTSDNLTQGMLGGGAVAALNRNGAAQDIAAKYGCGVYGIANGLDISAGTGLNVNVAAGQAILDGIVEFDAQQVKAVSPSISRIHLWLHSDGTIEAVNNSTTPPSGHVCYLGSAVTDGSGVTSVDQSGIVYYKQGQAWRETADTGVPGDSPGTSRRFFHRNATDTFYWDGYAYVRLPGDNELLRSVEVTFDNDGSALAANDQMMLRVPFDCDIQKVTALADVSGTVTVDIWNDTYANWPPTNADSITAAAPVALSTADKYEDATLTGWTTAISAGDTLIFNVDALATSITRLYVSLEVKLN